MSSRNGIGERYERLLAHSRELGMLASLEQLLGWDQETYMPAGGAEGRAELRAYVAGLLHQRWVAAELGELLGELSGSGRLADLGPEAAANVRELDRRHQRERKVPAALAQELARTAALAHQPWLQARRQNRFQLFAPWLERLVGLKREWAEAVGYEQEPYDALLDEYEPGTRCRELVPLLERLGDGLRTLLDRIMGSPPQAPELVFGGRFDPALQRRFGMQVAGELGFDFNAGRLDTSAHPFCAGLSECDVRITTRYNERNPTESLFSVVHEAGHGMYEQGLLREHRGTPMGWPASHGVHESQSRWWENCIARSRPFWEHYLPELRRTFATAVGDVSLDRFVLAVNRVRPSLIRVEADEVTYNLHILVRLDIERNLFNDQLGVADLPEAWNQLMERYLGLRPPDDANGVLQDIHWSMGAFGYFPSYSLGNLYAGQLHWRICRDLPELEDRVRRGQFAELLEWLRSHIHRHGSLYPPAELIRQATGQPPDSRYFLDYLQRKYDELYGLA